VIIDQEILNYPYKSYYFYIENFYFLDEITRLKLFEQIIKSDYYLFQITKRILNESEKDLLVNRILEKGKYKFINLIKQSQTLNEDQINKIDSLTVFGKLTGDLDKIEEEI